MLDTNALVAAARGEIDLNLLAKQELASRGMDKTGKWVGFEKARQIHLNGQYVWVIATNGGAK